MKIELELPDYSREQGLHLERAGDAILSVRIDLGEVVIAEMQVAWPHSHTIY